MGFTMPSVPALIGIGCAGLGLLLQIVGVATNGWAVMDLIFVTVKSGLWTWCPDVAGLNCGETPPYLLACRAFGILGVSLLAACAFLGILMCYVENVQAKFSLFAGMCGFAAGVSILLEFAIYAATSPKGLSYGYSFYLTIVAGVLAFAAGVCYILGRRRA